MAVDTRAHIMSSALQERAVLRRMTALRWRGSARDYGPTRCVYIQGHNGDEIRLALHELGEALRALKIRPADLGYPAAEHKESA